MRFDVTDVQGTIHTMDTDKFESKFLNIDCMEVLKRMPDKCVDLCIVDPPYGIKSTNFVTARMKKREDKKWNHFVPDDAYFNELYRVSKNQIIWGCNYYGQNIRHVGRIVFNKLMTSKKGPLKLSDCDLASVSIGNRIMYFEHQWSGNVQNGKMNCEGIENLAIGLETRIHPTQKPVALYSYLLKNYAKPGDKILDTHVGSASSLIACHQMGFEYWGFELDVSYFEAATERLNRVKAQVDIFEAAKLPKMEQVSEW